MPQNITLKLDPPQKKKEHRQSSIKASPTGVLNGKLNIKKYYFGSFMFILHTPKKVLNKILKCIFFPTNVIPTYLSKKPKPTKWGH
jgi:hypothetical protein